MTTHRTAKLDRRVPLSVAVMGAVLACLSAASIAGSAPAAPVAVATR